MRVGERVLERLSAAGMSQAELARRIGLAQPTINNLIRRNKVGTKHLHRIARELGTTPEYLTGETDDPAEGALPVPTADLVAEQVGAIMVPMLDLRFGMGGGNVVDAHSIIDRIPFPRDWLLSRIEGKPEQVMIITGEGDSMEPTIRSGDALLVDQAQRTVRQQDQIWAIGLHDVGMVKRLRRRKGGYEIISDNPAVPADRADDGEMEVVGRVIWIGRWQ
ncbi:XRE family transcriptional regulator [Sphingomonas profundi]|uniref:XRE family transcriptional regulator n=1 Tax=Alterirhizorhabdus profundi TaxID=2681549 RepID=UPI0012E86964|nr:XRE family transcriptional regulator [Sphingomonas profundi]